MEMWIADAGLGDGPRLVLGGFAQEAEDAGGCVGGCVSALAEQLF